MVSRGERRTKRAKGDDYALMPGLPHLGRYRMLSADVPWAHDNYGQAKHGAAKSAYFEMAMERVCSMPVGSLAHEAGAVLALWCTAAQAADGAHIAVASAWGFKLRSRLFSWVKVYDGCGGCPHGWAEHDAPGITANAPGPCRGNYDGCACGGFVVQPVRGPGSYSMQGVEDVWIGVRGDGWSTSRAERDVPEVIFYPRDEHSRKPDVMQRRMERLWPDEGPRLELFARRRLDGWAAWGNEAPECDEVFGADYGAWWPTLSPGDRVEVIEESPVNGPTCTRVVTRTYREAFWAEPVEATASSVGTAGPVRFGWADENKTWRRVA